MSNSLDIQYQKLLRDLLEQGIRKEDRTGTGTISLFGRQIRHKMSEGFPLLTTKKMAFKTMVVELLWFLRGDTNIKYLVDNDCNIWNGDAWAKYINEFRISCPKCPEITKEEFINKIKTDDEFAESWGDLGPIYGTQWREWNYKIDQIQNLINDLKTNPDSRRLLVSAWNVGELEHMTLPPCHYSFQCYVRDDKYLSLMFNQRSVDTFLGLPFNIASYGLLLKMLAKEVNMIPDELIGNLGDTHLYLNHVEQAVEQLTRTPYSLPNVLLRKACNIIGEKEYTFDDIVLSSYDYHPTIKAPLSN